MKLVVLRGPSMVGPFVLTPGELVIGRSADAAVCLPSQRVSRRHAVVRVRDPSGLDVVVADAGSQNGVLDAEGRRVPELRLAHGTRVQIGDYLLALELPVAAVSSQPPPTAEPDDLDLDASDDLELDEDASDHNTSRSQPSRSAPVGLRPGSAPFTAPPPGTGGPRPPQFPEGGVFVGGSAVRAPTAPAVAPVVANPPPPAPSPAAALPPPPGGAPFGLRPPAPSGTPGQGAAPPPPAPHAASAAPPPAWRPEPDPDDPATDPRARQPVVAAAPMASPPPPMASPPPPMAAPPPPMAAPPPPMAAPPPPMALPSTGMPGEAAARGPAPAAPAPAPVAPAAPSGLPWMLQASLVAAVAVGVPLCAPYGGILAQVGAASDAAHEISLARGAAIADVVGNRNAQAIAEQRGILLDVAFVQDRPGVRAVAVTDARGVVLAPTARLRTSVERHPAFALAKEARDVAMEPSDDGVWEIVTPVRADVAGSGARQVVGYAVIEYDPRVLADEAVNPVGRAVAGVVAALVALGALIAGAYMLVLRPLVHLREETELAGRGATDRVSSPVRLAQFEELTHSVNRLVARLRAR